MIDREQLTILAQIAHRSYSTDDFDPIENTSYDYLTSEILPDFAGPSSSNGPGIRLQSGFKGRAYISEESKTLVIGYAGTDFFDKDTPLASSLNDLNTDFQLAIWGANQQIPYAMSFADKAIREAADLGYQDYSVVFTGDSLGGALAQYAGAQYPDAQVVAFNPAGTGGLVGDPVPHNNNTTVVYQDPNSRALLSQSIYETGDIRAPKGRTPVIERSAKKFGESMISAVSNRGLMRFMLYDGALNVERFLTFLHRLIKDVKQKVFLNVDNLRVQHAKKVKAWVAAHAHEIELFCLPAYVPGHNPDEYLNNDLKQQWRQKPQPSSLEQLKSNIRSVMRSIQRTPERVISYFTPQPVRYAA